MPEAAASVAPDRAPPRRSRRPVLTLGRLQPGRLAGQIHQHDVGVISQSIEHDPLAVGRDVEVLNHRAALQVEAGELTLLAGLDIQAEKILIRSRALKSDERLS